LEKYRIYIAAISRDNTEVKWSVGYREFFLLTGSINKQL
jgi:hypothetical protein